VPGAVDARPVPPGRAGGKSPARAAEDDPEDDARHPPRGGEGRDRQHDQHDQGNDRDRQRRRGDEAGCDEGRPGKRTAPLPRREVSAVRKIGDQPPELAVGASPQGRVDALLELLGLEASLARCFAQPIGHRVAVGVRGSERVVAPHHYAPNVSAYRARREGPGSLSGVRVSKLHELQAFRTLDGSEIREVAGPARGDAVNQSLAEATVDPGGQTAEHFHKVSEEIYFFTQGRGRMRLGEAEHEVEAGSCVVIPPGVRHKLWNTGPEPLRLLCCCAPAYAHDDTVITESAEA
jgi:mannose-6-phosphate isomerase-like protein (cupin superfamily)